MITSRLLLRYLVFVGIPYVLAKKIETAFWERHKQKPKTKKTVSKVPELNKLPQNMVNGLKTRGGSHFIMAWFVKLVVDDFAIKVAIVGGFGASIWSQTADNAAAQLAKYGSAILAAPGKKFCKLYQRIKGVDPQHSVDIKEILFDRDLTNHDKLELLKIKIETVLKKLRHSKRKQKQFILFVIATLVFSLWGNAALLSWFMERLRALIGHNDDVDSIREYLIEIYKEFNAPLPRELVEQLPSEVIQSITNVD